MSATTLSRASGLTLLLGALLYIVGGILTYASLPITPLWLVTTGMWISGMALLLLGLPGIVARQATRAGWLGFVGFLLLFLGWLLLTGFYIVDDLILSSWLDSLAPHVYAQWFLNPAATVSVHVAFSLVGVGGALLGIATLRARVFSRWSGLLLVAGGVAGVASFVSGSLTTVATVLIVIGLGSMGQVLWAAPGEAAAVLQPAPF
ncbi:MAG: hypothetical protein C5B60_05200 [Chloroflexi bacterium]|nr:MAG: hypothetical protein C5B60_05200 [Chloroflexota bacterium]